MAGMCFVSGCEVRFSLELKDSRKSEWNGRRDIPASSGFKFHDLRNTGSKKDIPLCLWEAGLSVNTVMINMQISKTFTGFRPDCSSSCWNVHTVDDQQGQIIISSYREGGQRAWQVLTPPTFAKTQPPQHQRNINRSLIYYPETRQSIVYEDLLRSTTRGQEWWKSVREPVTQPL